MAERDEGLWVEVVGRVVPASDNQADALVAIDAEQFGDDVIYDYTTYLIEDVGHGIEIREKCGEMVVAAGYMHELPSGDPLLRVLRFEKW